MSAPAFGQSSASIVCSCCCSRSGRCSPKAHLEGFGDWQRVSYDTRVFRGLQGASYNFVSHCGVRRQPVSMLESERPRLEGQLRLHISFVAQCANPPFRHLQSVDSCSLAGLSWRLSEMVPVKPLAHSPTPKRDFVRR